MIGFLRKIETVLQSAIEGSPILSKDEVQPLDLVRQIEREIERNKKAFINDLVYVPHKLVIHLYAPSPAKVEEYEALFNNRDFRTYLDEYVRERGFKLLDRIRITIQCHDQAGPEFRGRHCYVEFSWPQASSDPGDLTIVVDPSDDGRFLSVQQPTAEVLEEAWLEVLDGEAYEPRVKIARREFNIGRTEHIVNARTKQVVRVNHLAFKRPAPGDTVNHSVSRQHARISHKAGGFVFCDTGSQNGSSVLRASSTILVPPGTSDGVPLENGDVLVLGRAKVRFSLGPASAEGDR